MKTRALIQAQARATVATWPAAGDAARCHVHTNATSGARAGVLRRPALDLLACALCLMILTLASGWMLVAAGIGQVVYPPRSAAAGNSELNALLRAIDSNDVPAARRLLRKQRFDVNVADDAGVQPIIYALRARGASANAFVDLLIAAGANVNGQGTDGIARSPLLMAATLTRPDLVERLLQAGADVGATRGNGWTALHFAAAYDDPETVAVLLAAGADSGAVDDEGDTPLAVALARGSSASAALRSHRGLAARTTSSRSCWPPSTSWSERFLPDRKPSERAIAPQPTATHHREVPKIDVELLPCE
jgi:hypothetical protein